MAKINITKPTGSEALTLLSAFQADNQVYVIFDSERIGSMGLPIIYISKYTDHLEKINDDNEWQSVKNYLKGIISGTNFQYVRFDNAVNADEVFYTPLTLPQASFDMIRSRYVVVDDSTTSSAAPALEPVPTLNNVPNPSVSEPVPGPAPAVNPVPVMPEEMPKPVQPEVSVAPIMPNVEAVSNETISNHAIQPDSKPDVVMPVKEEPTLTTPVMEPTSNKPIASMNLDTSSFMQDKETFLKACENMFDALVSKYQKQLTDLEVREQELAKKEQEINVKLKNASEHLANAEAREQVANIAHDNAQKIMDISNLMPNNPNSNPTGVI